MQISYRDFEAKYNCRVVHYPNHDEITVCNRYIFNPHKFEKQVIKNSLDCKRSYSKENVSRLDSIRRSKRKALEIAYANKFKYFVTFTLDQRKIDRYDENIISSKFKKWLDNNTQRKHLQYLIFPERHKDGAIHFHGLCNGDLKLISSGHFTHKRHQEIFNAENWSLGFSTVVVIDDNYEATIRYCMKYITKNDEKIFGKFYFAGGLGLKRELPKSYMDIPFDEFEEKEHYVQNSNMIFKYRNEDYE